MDNITPTTHLAQGGAHYNPYDGREKLKIIMSDIFAQLENHQDFGVHLTSTRFSYKFTLEVKDDREDPTIMQGWKTLERRYDLEGSSSPAPDDGRRKAGLVVPQPTLTTAGLVDVPLQKQ